MRASERAYYDRRAAEYDDWWLGRGQFAGVDRPGWDEELRALVAVLTQLPRTPTLDVACGTGFLTQHLPGPVTALDASAAMLAIARTRRPEATFVEGDALDLPFVGNAFGLVFTAHFYGHLRAAHRARFLAEARRVAPALVVVDSALRAGVPPETVNERVLSDGSRHRVFKRCFTGDSLAGELGGRDVLLDGDWFVAVSA